ncbi:N-lysine methyltransferase KMT5A-A [Holothuria leucospilota]|uniref:N-lysine methyltransferase KMT5A-A n=1 Tax=Holothuria leucospilota TaxID=206669 RepID=A0A9Q0YAR4_HOLLE|nr:N-lysine methyltransferase KMT5A-A [Holothuria leucospilota]
MSRRRRGKPADVAISMVKQKLDRDGLYVEEIPPKGRGVFAKVSVTKGEFLLQYAGKLIPGDEGDKLEEEGSSGFRFFITFKGKDYCIDATEEPEEGLSLGRLVNHGGKKEVNVKLSVIDVDSKPDLFNEQQEKSDVSYSAPPSMTIHEHDAKGSHLVEKDTSAEEFCMLLSHVIDLSNSHISSSGPKANTLWKQNEKEIENEQKGEEPEPDLFVPDTSDGDSDASGSDSQSMDTKGSHLTEKDTPAEEFCLLLSDILDCSNSNISCSGPKANTLWKQNEKEIENEQEGEEPEPHLFVPDTSDGDSDASGNDSQSMTADDKLIRESECTDEGVVSTTDPKQINPKSKTEKNHSVIIW